MCPSQPFIGVHIITQNKGIGSGEGNISFDRKPCHSHSLIPKLPVIRNYTFVGPHLTFVSLPVPFLQGSAKSIMPFLYNQDLRYINADEGFIAVLIIFCLIIIIDKHWQNCRCTSSNGSFFLLVCRRVFLHGFLLVFPLCLVCLFCCLLCSFLYRRLFLCCLLSTASGKK